MTVVHTGLDRLAAGELNSRIRNRNVGLVAHPASVTQGYVHAKDVLLAQGAKIAALFGPEHGYGGEAQDMIGVQNSRDLDTSAPIHSLYGDSFESLSPKREWLDGLDALVIDLQDVGARYYTFVWTAVLCARVCSTLGIETIVLDRPNPLGGLVVEGAPQLDAHLSFVGLRSVPVRHGLTIGELVLDAARQERLDGVSVIEMHGWNRSMLYRDTGCAWVLPSPNMPTPETALVYPGGCLLEATNVSEGRGTTRPFELFGAPFVNAPALAKEMQQQAGTGCVVRATTARPTFHKWAQQTVGAVQVHVTDAHAFRSYRAYLAALIHLRKYSEFSWRTETYEFVNDVPAMDLLTGDSRVRLAIDDGATIEDVLAIGADRLSHFNAGSRWIYP
jgi:uncharacterized protein YbbC (DUF1343 family)